MRLIFAPSPASTTALSVAGLLSTGEINQNPIEWQIYGKLTTFRTCDVLRRNFFGCTMVASSNLVSFSSPFSLAVPRKWNIDSLLMYRFNSFLARFFFPWFRCRFCGGNAAKNQLSSSQIQTLKNERAISKIESTRMCRLGESVATAAARWECEQNGKVKNYCVFRHRIPKMVAKCKAIKLSRPWSLSMYCFTTHGVCFKMGCRNVRIIGSHAFRVEHCLSWMKFVIWSNQLHSLLTTRKSIHSASAISRQPILYPLKYSKLKCAKIRRRRTCNVWRTGKSFWPQVFAKESCYLLSAQIIRECLWQRFNNDALFVHRLPCAHCIFVRDFFRHSSQLE